MAIATVSLVGGSLVGGALTPAAAASTHRHGQHSRYDQVNLVADQAGWAQTVDPNLVNPWGLSEAPQSATAAGSPIWVSDNVTGLSTLYAGGQAGQMVTVNPLVVTVPGGGPTGTVFNGTTGFVLTQDGKTGSAKFLFASVTGNITGWNPTGVVTNAVVVAHTKNAIYTGLALLNAKKGPELLAANFHSNRIDVFDTNFARVHDSHAFRSVGIPRGYAPFNVAVLGNRVFVSYAKQNATKDRDVAGKGHGFVNVFDSRGHFISSLVRRGPLNSPWGLTIAPAGFGSFTGDLLVGNFGNGRIHVFSPRDGHFIGTLRDATGTPIVIDGLWALLPGNNTAAASSDIWFSAGPDGGSHGLLGVLRLTATS